MVKLASAVLLTALLSSAVYAQTNAGEQKPDPDLPFTMTQVASFDLPWRIAFLPDGRMLVTEKVGRVDLVTQQGAKTEVAGRPAQSITKARTACWASSSRPITPPTTMCISPMSNRVIMAAAWRWAAGQLVLDGDRRQAGRVPGAVAPDAQGQGRPGRRADRLLAGRQLPLPHGGRSPAHSPPPRIPTSRRARSCG